MKDLQEELEERLEKLKLNDESFSLEERLDAAEMILTDEFQKLCAFLLEHRHFNIATQALGNTQLPLEEFRVKQGEFLGIEHAITMMLSFALNLRGYRDEDEELFNDEESED